VLPDSILVHIDWVDRSAVGNHERVHFGTARVSNEPFQKVQSLIRIKREAFLVEIQPVRTAAMQCSKKSACSSSLITHN